MVRYFRCNKSVNSSNVILSIVIGIKQFIIIFIHIFIFQTSVGFSFSSPNTQISKHEEFVGKRLKKQEI